MFCRYSPHVQKLWTVQQLVIDNSDAIGHVPFLSAVHNKAAGLLIPTKASVAVSFPLAEKIPVKITCAVHPWMTGYVVIRPNPYVDVSAADGSFTIANLPTSEFTFQLWSESLGYLKKVTVGGKKESNRKGLHSFTIQQGENNLGKIVIDAVDHVRQLKKLK